MRSESRIDFLKQVLTFFNVFFLIAGLGVLGVGIWTVVDRHNYTPIILSTTYAVAAYLLIGAGCLVLITSAIGFVGLCKLRKSWMVAYILLLLLIFILEAAAGVLAYLRGTSKQIFPVSIWSDLNHRLKEIIAKDYGTDLAMSNSMDSLQKSFTCCGSADYSDWQNSDWGNAEDRQHDKLADYIPVPDSCCKNTTTACGFRSHPSNIYYDGCTSSFAAFLRERLYIIGGVGIGICAVQLFGAVLSCCLVARLKKPKEPILRYDYTRAG
ncbi:tetraspanin-11-like [Paramacrobiotus metropolitanus]|uniref:tetraspanin-11-like n=1 Tax=Paramacrobiotus metropolitanus TaxID=2943436 RepID=UPI002445F1A1|nr:tetraspanin-11-like [Paramacrobiotus metropolitanus]